MLVSKTFSPKRISRNGEQRNVVGMCWRGHYSSYSFSFRIFMSLELYPFLPLLHSCCKSKFPIFVSLKMLAAILSLFFLMLSVLPCSDKAPGEKLKLEQVAASDCDNPEAGDLCSPFCHCQCCSMHYISFNVFMFKVIKPEDPQASFAFFDDQEQEVLHSFHQPPRV